MSLSKSLEGLEASFVSFAETRLTFGPTLVCPTRVLWREYKEHCEKWSFVAVDAEWFVDCLRKTGVALKTGGGGRLRSYAQGVGFKSTADDPF